MFAEHQQRHPGIVVGRLQHEELIPWKNLRELLVPVERHLGAWIDKPGPGDETPPRVTADDCS